jgi:hypothetical protein
MKKKSFLIISLIALPLLLMTSMTTWMSSAAGTIEVLAEKTAEAENMKRQGTAKNIFVTDTHFKLYRLNRYYSSGRTEIVSETSAPSMNEGTGINKLGVIRNGSAITLSINSVVLGSWTDSGIDGMTRAGVLTNPYPNKGPYGDARFDNFRLADYPGIANGPISELKAPLFFGDKAEEDPIINRQPGRSFE